jgi:hypothetical protein
MFDGAFDFDVVGQLLIHSTALLRQKLLFGLTVRILLRRRSRSAALPGALRLDGWTTVRALQSAPA